MDGTQNCHRTDAEKQRRGHEPTDKALGIRQASLRAAFDLVLDAFSKAVEQFFDFESFAGNCAEDDARKRNQHVLSLGEEMHAVSQGKKTQTCGKSLAHFERDAVACQQSNQPAKQNCSKIEDRPNHVIIPAFQPE